MKLARFSTVIFHLDHDGAAARTLQERGVDGAKRTQCSTQTFAFRLFPRSEQRLHGSAQLRHIERFL